MRISKKCCESLNELIETGDVEICSFTVSLIINNELVPYSWDEDHGCFISQTWDGTNPYLKRLEVINSKPRLSFSLEHQISVGAYLNPNPSKNDLIDI